MPRAPFQVLVFPLVRSGNKVRYALFRRADESGDCWQGIAGGGEEGESPVEAARREASEEAGIDNGRPLVELDSRCTIPVVSVAGFLWGPDVLVIPEYPFGIELDSESIQISHEHTHVRWTEYDEAARLVRWDSNRAALWELDHRIRNRMMAK